MAQAIVQSSCRKLRSAIGDEATMRLNFTGDLQEILEQLVDLDAVIPNAENCWMDKDDYLDEQAPCWLAMARDAAYRVCHMVDELQEITVPAAANKMSKLINRVENINVVVEPTSKEIMLAKMKGIKEKLMELQRVSFLFDDVAKRRALLRAPAATVGREEDVENILAQLFSCDSSEGPTTLLIQGLQGVGKATVATLVFDDDRFKFYTRVWINQSHNLNLHGIGECIISQLVPAGEEEMSGTHVSDDDMGMGYITDRLHELLNGKKVLIVLHNLNGRDSNINWKGLNDMMSTGGMCNTQVIVIATIDTCEVTMETFGAQSYCLAPLSEEMCCKIIKQAAIHSQDISANKEDLERIAGEVAKLCKGIPMAAQLFGCLLRFKPYRGWPELLDFKAMLAVDGPVCTSMELNYRSMPPNLKLCFACCAFIFVTGRDIVKEDVIHQWIALDLIEPSKEFSTTQLAEQYLRRLLEMSLLQTAKSSRTSAKDDTCATSFTMHDLVGLSGIYSTREEFCLLEKDRSPRYTKYCSYVSVPRHMRLGFDQRELMSIFPDHNIRVLHFVDCRGMKLHDDSFLFARSLRVLELHKSSMQELPESICQMRHLGYLKLSGCSGLVTLPESFGDLINLLHINLSSCSGLVSLPESFGKLLNLVHLSLSCCPKLKILPESFVKLTKLVHINLSGSSALAHLPGYFGRLINLVLINLSGCLALESLPRSFGKLTKLEHINLSDCPKLGNLPGSFGKLTNLVHINLSGCCGLVNLPGSFGKLTSLAHINLSGCSGLEELPQSFGNLISLVHINLSDCSALVTLPESFGDLKNLLHADLSRCYGLSKLPESFRHLKKLVHLDLSFWSCFDGIETALGGLTNLQHLDLSNPCCYRADYPHLKGVKHVLGQFVRLKHLNLSMFLNPIFRNQSEEENYKYIELICGFPQLKYLDLSHNIFLHDLPNDLFMLSWLHTVDLSGCIRLKKVGNWMAEMRSLSSVVLSNLEMFGMGIISRGSFRTFSPGS